MINSKETQTVLKSNFGSQEEIDYWVNTYHSKPINYIKDTYYRVERGTGSGYAGVGNGLYLGKDLDALANFYDLEQEGLETSEYKGKVKWLNLTSQKKFSDFVNKLKNQGINIVNSDKVGDIVKGLGFDGIKYYDPMATGEEYVLYDTNKVSKVIKESINKNKKMKSNLQIRKAIRLVESITGKKVVLRESVDNKYIVSSSHEVSSADFKSNEKIREYNKEKIIYAKSPNEALSKYVETVLDFSYEEGDADLEDKNCYLSVLVDAFGGEANSIDREEFKKGETKLYYDNMVIHVSEGGNYVSFD